MANIGKCVKCEKRLTSIRIEDVKLTVNSTPTYKGVSFVCPYCHAILGVGVNPFGIANETVDAVTKALKNK
jgi:uncharacterized protein with PIN domain